MDRTPNLQGIRVYRLYAIKPGHALRFSRRPWPEGTRDATPIHDPHPLKVGRLMTWTHNKRQTGLPKPASQNTRSQLWH